MADVRHMRRTWRLRPSTRSAPGRNAVAPASSTHAGRRCHAVLQRHALASDPAALVADRTLHRDPVALPHPVARVHQPMGQARRRWSSAASLRCPRPAGRRDTPASTSLHQIHDGRASLRIAYRRHVPVGLVERDVHQLCRGAEHASVDLDASVAGSIFVPGRGRLTPLTRTRPCSMIVSHARRDATPHRAINFCSRSGPSANPPRPTARPGRGRYGVMGVVVDACCPLPLLNMLCRPSITSGARSSSRS